MSAGGGSVRPLEGFSGFQYCGFLWSPVGRPVTPPSLAFVNAAHLATPRDGNGRLNPILWIVAAVAVLATPSCTKPGSAAETGPASRGADSKPAEAQPTTLDRIRVRTQVPSRDTIASFLETTSHIEAIHEAELFAKTTGIVRQLNVEEGDRVVEGQILAVLDQVEAKIALKQAEIAQEEAKQSAEEASLAFEESLKKESLAKSDATQAKRDYDRDATLSNSANETGLQILAPKLVEASKLAWERAENNYQVSQFTTKKSALAMKAGETTKAKADWAAELARARLTDTEIKAHFAGVVSFRGIKVGETATPQTKVFRITDLENLQTVFYRPQRDLKLLVNGGQDVTATSEAIPNDPNTNELRSFRGRVERISPVVDPLSGSFKVTASLKNPEHLLRPGILVRVRVTLGRRENAYLIPKRARVLEGEKPFVFVVRDGKTVRIPIDEGFSDDTRIEVRNINDQGLRADDQVVVVANVDLKEGLKVTLDNAPAGG